MGEKPDAEGQGDAGIPDMGEKPDAEGQGSAGMPDMTKQGSAGASDAKRQPGNASAHERKDNRSDFTAQVPDAASGGRENRLMLAGCAAVLLAAIIAVIRYSSRR